MPRMSQIDFIGIGAPKCGTTWLSAQLEAHPQIGFAPDKEVYYFADTIMRRLAGSELNCFERGESWYHRQFPPRPAPILDTRRVLSFLPLPRRSGRPHQSLPSRYQTPPLPATAGRDDLLVVLVRSERSHREVAGDLRRDDAKSLPARHRMFRPPFRRTSSVSRRRTFSSFSSTPSAARLTKFAGASTSFLGSIRTSNRNSTRAKTKPALRAFRSFNRPPKVSTKESPRCRRGQSSNHPSSPRRCKAPITASTARRRIRTAHAGRAPQMGGVLRR